MQLSQKAKAGAVRPGKKFKAIILLFLFLLSGINYWSHHDSLKNYIPTITDYPMYQVSVASPELPVPSPSPGKYAVWMFPFPPKSSPEEISISVDETLICAYSNACKDYPSHSKINLRELTIGTYYHNYVRDHIYYKVCHMSEFPFHIQAITMMALLQRQPGKIYLLGIQQSCIFNIAKVVSCYFSHQLFTSPTLINLSIYLSIYQGSCVRMLGSSAAFCDDKPFSNYNPYSSDHLNSTKYPLPFINSITTDVDHCFLSMHDITMTAEKFAMWGHEDLPAENMAAGRYNSGEDVQSYAGAGWLPFISEIRFKDNAILNYTGYFIANALLTTAYETSEADSKNMKNIQMLSIYGGAKQMDGMKNYLEKYTEAVEPFGCRSKLTCRELKARRIKSYFSACLTLTVNMQGGLLDGREKSFNRHVYNEILNPNTIESVPEKNKIVLVDVQDKNIVPKNVWNSPNAIHLKADIHPSYPSLTTKMGRYGYSYKLLSTYAREAKVIITSRIHVGLPAAALGVPVIFVESGSGWLPGGRQKVGRVEGLLDVFHRVQAGDNSKNWTFGDLDGEIPHNDGVHLADRYRASFWHRLKKTHFYDDTARLYGMIPLKRLGQKNVKIGIQDKFHFVLSRSDLGWQTRRAIEHVFFFHPNCRVFVHSNDIYAGASDLDIFVESGYDLSVQKYDSKSLKDKFSSSSELPIVFSILFKYGGVYLSKNTLLANEISANLEEGLVLDGDGNPAMAFYHQNSSNERAMKVLHGTPPSWSFPVLSSVETDKCANDPNWKLGEGFESSSSLAVSLDASSYASFGAIKIDAECYKVVEEPCIYCDDLHWEY